MARLEVPMAALRPVPAATLLLLAAFAFAPPVAAQLTPVVQPGDTIRFVGADIHRSTSADCGNNCYINVVDLGVEEVQIEVASGLGVGILDRTATAAGRLLSYFKIAGDNGHRIGAKLDGSLRWRGWVTADFGAFDNTASVDIAVALYDVTSVTNPADVFKQLVARQTVFTQSVAGQLSAVPIPDLQRCIGTGSYNLAVDLVRGHTYVAVTEVICRSSSGLVGVGVGVSFAREQFSFSPIDDGFVERTRMILRTEPDYLELIANLQNQFQNHRHDYLTGRGQGHNNVSAETSGPKELPAGDVDPGTGGGVGVSVPGPVCELRTASPEHVRITVALPAGAEPGALLERSTNGTDWIALGVVADGVDWMDRDVLPGARYSYRANATVGGVALTGEPISVRTPETHVLALAGALPNPAVEDLLVRFSLPDATPAVLELFDVTGRQVMTKDVGPLGPGEHSVRLAQRGALAPGIYLLRLTRGPRTLTSRLTVMR
jgi:hypothetical protein